MSDEIERLRAELAARNETATLHAEELRAAMGMLAVHWLDHVLAPIGIRHGRGAAQDGIETYAPWVALTDETGRGAFVDGERAAEVACAYAMEAGMARAERDAALAEVASLTRDRDLLAADYLFACQERDKWHALYRAEVARLTAERDEAVRRHAQLEHLHRADDANHARHTAELTADLASARAEVARLRELAVEMLYQMGMTKGAARAALAAEPAPPAETGRASHDWRLLPHGGPYRCATCGAYDDTEDGCVPGTWVRCTTVRNDCLGGCATRAEHERVAAQPAPPAEKGGRCRECLGRGYHECGDSTCGAEGEDCHDCGGTGRAPAAGGGR